jgi:hypothetical protein
VSGGTAGLTGRRDGVGLTLIQCAVRLGLRALLIVSIFTNAAAAPAAPPGAVPAAVGRAMLVARGVTSDATASNNGVKLLRVRRALVAAYTGGTGDAPQILLAVSRDNGAHWAPLGQASEGPVPSRLAALAADASGHLHVVWTRYDDRVGKVYHREWAGPGAGAWTGPQRRLSLAGVYAGYPAVAVDHLGRPAVVWYGIREGPASVPTKHGSIYEIFYAAFDGRAWSHPLLISTGVPDSINPALASDFAGRLHAAWYQFNGRVYQVRYAERDGAWSAPEGVSRAPADEFNPDLAAGPVDRLALAWEQHAPQGSIIEYTRRTGAGWEMPVAVSEGAAAFHPSVSIDATGTIWIAWDADDGQIYARRFKNRWGPVLRLTTDGGNAFPSALSEGGALDVLWTHQSGAGDSVFFARVIARP